MSAHVLLNSLNEFRKSYEIARLAEHFITYSQQVYLFNNTGARVIDYIYHMILKLL